MFSHPEVRARLARNYVALRIDWEQGKHYQSKLGRIPGTGCQMILDPKGNLVTEVDAYASRYGRDLTPKILDEISARYPPKAKQPGLRIEWFLWPKDRKGMWPASVDDISSYTRTPQAWIEGPIPAALLDPNFLRWHVRQFIWIRGNENAPGRIAVKRIADGLKSGLPIEIAAIPAALSPEKLGKALDQAWLVYMKDRPRTARGYAENPAGRMFERIKDHMIGEEDAIEALAKSGSLLAPGRAPGERPPYLGR